MRKIVVAIDGYSSCGKSTLAKQLAAHFNYTFVDTGAMYRAVALFAIREGFMVNNLLNENSLVEALDRINLNFIPVAGGGREITLNEERVEPEIRAAAVSNAVSYVAAIPAVRARLVEQQQRMGELGGIVMDGRDIGTVVFPNAHLKLFVTASEEVRIERRYNELIQKGASITREEVSKNIQERDHIDTTRAADPLRQAADAVVLDNSNLSIDEQFDVARVLVESRSS